MCAAKGLERSTLVLAYSNVRQRDGALDLRTGSREKQLLCMTCNTPAATYHGGRWITMK